MIVTEFRRSVEDILEPHHDDEFLMKWLIARDFDLNKAEKMIRENFIFRKKFGLNTITNDYILPEVYKQYKCTAFLGFDKGNSAVRLFMIGLCDIKGFLQSMSMLEIMKALMYFLEYDLKLMRDRKKETGEADTKTTFILDYTDFSFKKFYHKQIIKVIIQLLNMYQDNYPETMKTTYLINVPSYFYFLFNIFKPFIPAATLKKVKIFGSEEWQEELRSIMDPNLIPGFLGGNLTDTDGNPKCTHLINWNSKINPSYYLSPDSDTMEDSSMTSATVQKRGVLQIPVDVKTTGLVLKWTFSTKEYNIRFGLFLKKGEGSSHLEEVIPVESVDCHIMREENEIVCEKTGTYVLHFDNSYSWLTAKKVYYKVEVEKLIECCN